MAISKASVTIFSVSAVDKNHVSTMLNVTKGAGQLRVWSFQTPFFFPDSRLVLKLGLCFGQKEKALVALRACVALEYELVSLNPFVHQK